MGTAADIRGAVYEALRNDPVIDPDDIDVEVMGGDVLLNGTVPSEAQRTEATVAVQRAAGVSTVHNLLDVALPSDDYGDDAALAWEPGPRAHSRLVCLADNRRRT